MESLIVVFCVITLLYLKKMKIPKAEVPKPSEMLFCRWIREVQIYLSTGIHLNVFKAN